LEHGVRLHPIRLRSITTLVPFTPGWGFVTHATVQQRLTLNCPIRRRSTRSGARGEIGHAIVDGHAGASSAYLRSIAPVRNSLPDPVGPTAKPLIEHPQIHHQVLQT